jgi:acyl-coenzyme A synthetase/AMP-(fatty) acid ligase
MAREPGLTASDILLALTTVSFDIAGLELFLPLIKGARVVVASRKVVGDGRRLGELMDSCGATVLQATPATLRMLLESGWPGRKAMKILCGGEALAPDLATELIGRCRSLWNMYGPTETTIWSTLAQVQVTQGPITIGRPIANTQVYLLDRYGQPVPVGVAGELHIGGVGVARAYLNREELTREKFVADSFCAQAGARMYRTGDLAKYRPDGQIEWLGRIDHQVKIRGFRVELGEIESILTEHAAVREVVVVVREDLPAGKRLVAYFTARDGQSVDVSELRERLRGKVPDYMVPSAFVTLDKLPLTPNGKVDRKALPSDAGRKVDAGLGWAPPEDEAEQSIARVWAEVLGVERVARDSNFFDLGGHSLLLISARRRLEDIFGREVPVVELFRHSTVRSLAKYLTGTEVESAGWSDGRTRPRAEKGLMQRHRALRQRVREQLSVH